MTINGLNNTQIVRWDHEECEVWQIQKAYPIYKPVRKPSVTMMVNRNEITEEIVVCNNGRLMRLLILM